MAQTLEQLATQLANDQDFAKLPQVEQDTVFASLANDLERPASSSTAQSLVRTAGTAPIATAMDVVRRPLSGIIEAPQQLAQQTMKIPQSIIDVALPTVGGMQAGIPGMAVGGGLAKALSLARRDQGTSGTMPQALQATQDVLGSAAMTAGTGTALNFATGGLRALRIARNVPLRAGFVRSVRQAFLDSKKLAGTTFGTKLDSLANAHPEQTIDLSAELATVHERALNNPALKSMLDRAALNSKESGMVQSLLNQPDVAVNLTMKESQTLKNVVSRMLKQRFQQVSPELTDAHLDLNDFYHGIRLAQLKAFPEFEEIASAYHTALTRFRMVKPYLTPAALEPALLSQFGKRAEIQEAVRELLPKETVNEITRFIRASLLPQRLRTAGKWGIGGLTVEEIIRRATK